MITLYGGKTLEQIEALLNATIKTPAGPVTQAECDFYNASRAAIPALIARIRELEEAARPHSNNRSLVGGGAGDPI